MRETIALVRCLDYQQSGRVPKCLHDDGDQHRACGFESHHIHQPEATYDMIFSYLPPKTSCQFQAVALLEGKKATPELLSQITAFELQLRADILTVGIENATNDQLIAYVYLRHHREMCRFLIG